MKKSPDSRQGRFPAFGIRHPHPALQFEIGLPFPPWMAYMFCQEMKMLIKMALLAVIASSSLLAADGDDPPKVYEGGSKHVIDRHAPHLFTKGKHREWRMWYIFKGTRSEGLHGELVINGKIKTGTKAGEKFESDGRTLIWHGAWNDRRQLFTKSGWLPEDLTTVYPSWNPKAEPAGTGQPGTRSQSKSEGGDKPQPESEGRSR